MLINTFPLTVMYWCYVIYANINTIHLYLQKYAHRKREYENGINNIDESSQKSLCALGSYLRSGTWWIGILLMVLGEAGNFIAYGFAPASVVAPLG